MSHYCDILSAKGESASLQDFPEALLKQTPSDGNWPKDGSLVNTRKDGEEFYVTEDQAAPFYISGN